ADRQYYHLRVTCRGRNEVQTAPREDLRPTRGVERYVFQFWPQDLAKAAANTQATWGNLMTTSPLQSHEQRPPSADGEIVAHMLSRLGAHPADLTCQHNDEGYVIALEISYRLPLREFPPELWRLKELRSLSIWGQKELTEEVPPEIGQLTALERLD